MANFLSPLLRGGSLSYHLVNERSARPVATRLLPAFDSKTRRTGLLAYKSLPPDSAMIIAPSGGIHTFFMKFAIDVLFVSKEGRVVKVCQAVQPWRIAISLSAFCAIELAAFAADRSDTRSGDKLVLRPAEASE